MSETDVVKTARELAPQIRSFSEQAEAERRLPADLVRLMTTAGLFRIYLPASLGGLECSLLECHQVIEEVSAADGSAGWCLLKGSSTNFLAGFLPRDVAEEIWGPDPDIVTGGSFNPMNGKAVAVEGGYRLSGRWDWGTGSTHSAWLLGGAMLWEDGGTGPVMTETGPTVQAFLFPRADAEIVDTWFTHGMKGTGSNDIVVDDLFVPERFAFPGLSAQPVEPGTLFQIGFHSQSAVPHSAVAIGIARAAIESFVELASAKSPLMAFSLLRNRESAQHKVAEATALVEASRAYAYRVIDDLWDTVAGGSPLSPQQVASVSLMAAWTTKACVQAVDLVYEAAGGSSVYLKSPIQRNFRDIHVAGSHFSVDDQRFTAAGKGILGAD